MSDVSKSYRPARCCKVTFRPHHITEHGMWSVAAHRMVCVCVCLLQGHKSQPTKKTTELIEMLFGCGLIRPKVLDAAWISLEKRHYLRNGNTWV